MTDCGVLINANLNVKTLLPSAHRRVIITTTMTAGTLDPGLQPRVQVQP